MLLTLISIRKIRSSTPLGLVLATLGHPPIRKNTRMTAPNPGLNIANLGMIKLPLTRKPYFSSVTHNENTNLGNTWELAANKVCEQFPRAPAE